MIIMRKSVIEILPILFLLVMASCGKSDLAYDRVVSGGEKDTISISISCFLESVKTKGQVDDMLVEDINLYIVNHAGDLVTYGYYDSIERMEAQIYENKEHTIYLIANAGKPIYASNANEIENIIHTVDSHPAMFSERGGIIMAGKSDAMTWNDGDVVKVGLTRCISKIVLKCNFSALNSDVNIDVNRVSLRNIPGVLAPFKLNRAAEASETIDGDTFYTPARQDLENGIIFYQYENCQGTLLPDNDSQSAKVWPEESLFSKICSYIEMEASYSSPRKRGNIVYRFYLGKDMTSNFDVVRNTQHVVVVNFKDDGAVDENTWRVDKSSIEDLVTSVTLDKDEYTFDEWGMTIQLMATVLPVTANNRNIAWSSSNESVAVVDEYGKVTSVNDGTCSITATSMDGTNISASCTVVVDARIPVTSITLTPTSVDMYEGLRKRLSAQVLPENATNKEIIWKSSNESVAKVDAEGVVAGGATLGSCFIYAISADDQTIFAKSEINLKPVQLVAITGDRNITIKVGESYQLTWWSNPADAVVTFRSCNSPCLTVDEKGVITGISPTQTIVDIFGFGSRDFYYVDVVE